MKNIKTLRNDEPKILNAYDSMASCAAALGIPMSTLKFAKKSGCNAFQASRINTLPLIRWLFAQSENEDSVKWGEEYKKWQSKREKLRFDEDQELLVSRSDIESALSRGMSMLFDQMDRRFNLELPPALKGLPEKEILAQLLKVAEELKETVRSELKSLAKKESKKKEASE